VAGIEAIVGAAAFLASLPRERWAIVTSAPRLLAEARIAAAGLPMPAVLVAAEDVERGKPAPDPFLLGARKLGVAPAIAWCSRIRWPGCSRRRRPAWRASS
jgi:sugar-phosphatase